jgi:hypothetical protein
MDVLLDEDEQVIQEAVRHYFDAECDTDRVRRIEDDGAFMDSEMWQQLAELRDRWRKACSAKRRRESGC